VDGSLLQIGYDIVCSSLLWTCVRDAWNTLDRDIVLASTANSSCDMVVGACRAYHDKTHTGMDRCTVRNDGGIQPS
jgi:hypothetical protein